ncbi:CDP-2,3-bis-(O-geranylgeranyl)-sn-glycerol synthase [Candidatus Bathyarchaeota archaeon]|nr:CDP-2,3-bis-(O-geranylgeranyl)-sn-glycerol synthase [Candidatus Bathyarchaeota archaeon]
MGILIIEAFQFIFPAYCANALPVIFGGGRPLDFGKTFFDKKRILGNNKTLRGFILGLTIGTAIGLVWHVLFAYPISYSFLLPLGALLGDLAGSFLKRRLDIKPGGLMPIVDQVDFVIGAILLSLPLNILSWELALTAIIITPPIHLLTNFGAYKLGLKKNPW